MPSQDAGAADSLSELERPTNPRLNPDVPAISCIATVPRACAARVRKALARLSPAAAIRLAAADDPASPLPPTARIEFTFAAGYLYRLLDTLVKSGSQGHPGDVVLEFGADSGNGARKDRLIFSN